MPADGLNYAEVGATRDPVMPVSGGYSRQHRRERVGGPEAFDRAVEHVLAYGLQRGAGFEVSAAQVPLRRGDDLVMRVRIGPIRVTAPARVVYVVDEPDRRGFAYGTLPGHPECGEEAFLVERDDEGTHLVIRAFSRPGRWFTRLAGPVGRHLQHRATAKYVAALRAAVRAS